MKIQEHIGELYHTKVSKDLISTITDEIIEEATKVAKSSLYIYNLVFRLYVSNVEIVIL